jgi:RNA polymerase sigma-70 factor (ECF subfamily)
MAETVDQRAFLALVNAHRAVVNRVCRAYTATPGDREELFQEIVHQLWRSYPSFRGESTPVTWVYRVALNTSITAVRRRTRRPAHVPLESTAEPVSRETGGEDARLALLYRAIRQLDDVERALIMCYLDDLSYKRIAEVLGISESNVGAKLNRTRAKLRDLVKRME